MLSGIPDKVFLLKTPAHYSAPPSPANPPNTYTYTERRMDLQEQAQQLRRQMNNREKRRAAQGSRGDDAGSAYDEHNKPRKKRAEPLKAAQQAYAAVMAAAALTPQPVQRCELCQASFVTEAQLQQHLDGPVHKKAVEKAQREAAKQAHVNQHSAVAQEALAAAAWLGSGGSSRTTTAGHHKPQQQQQQQQQQQSSQARPQGKQQQGRSHDRRQQGRGDAAGGTRSTGEQLTHEQVLAAARHDSRPLTLDGWVPPSVPAAQRPPHAAEAGLVSGQHCEPGKAGSGEQQAVPDGGQDQLVAGAAAAQQQQQDEGAGSPDAVKEPGDDASAGSSSSSESDDDEEDIPKTFESFF